MRVPPLTVASLVVSATLIAAPRAHAQILPGPDAPDIDALPPDRHVHYVILQLRNALTGLFGGAAAETFASLDLGETAEADAEMLQWFAADRALRVLAPMALDAVMRTREAARLRACAPIEDTRSAALMARNAVVARALHRRDRIETIAVERWATRIAEFGLEEPHVMRTPDREERIDAADRAVIAAADAVNHRDMLDVAIVVRETMQTVGEGPNREAVAGVALEMLTEMVALARTSRVPVREPTFPDEPALDPFAPPVPHTIRVRGRRVLVPTDDPIRSPTGSCMDDFLCLPP